MGLITSELWFEMFCYLFIKKIKFFLKKTPTDYNPNYFWTLTVQDWSKISPNNAVRPLRTLNFFVVSYIEIFC